MRPFPRVPPEIPQEADGETDIELGRALDLIDILGAQLQPQRLDIGLQVLDFAPADDGEHVGRFVHHVRQRHGRERRVVESRGHFLEHGGDALLFGRGAAHLAALAPGLLLLLPLLRGFEVAAAEGAPGRETHALVGAHVEDVALEVAVCGRPFALVDDELAEALLAGVFVGFGDDPGRGVADAEVEDFAGGDDVVERVHEFGDRGCEVPPVDVEDVDEVGLEFLQAGVEGVFEGFLVVADVVGLDDVVEAFVGLVAGCEFRSDDHLVSKAFGFGGEPFADPDLGLLGLVVAGCINEVAALAVEEIEDTEDVGFRHRAHHVGPADRLLRTGRRL